jgi:hypothetical protein
MPHCRKSRTELVTAKPVWVTALPGAASSNNDWFFIYGWNNVTFIAGEIERTKEEYSQEFVSLRVR